MPQRDARRSLTTSPLHVPGRGERRRTADLFSGSPPRLSEIRPRWPGSYAQARLRFIPTRYMARAAGFDCGNRVIAPGGGASAWVALPLPPALQSNAVRLRDEEACARDDTPLQERRESRSVAAAGREHQGEGKTSAETPTRGFSSRPRTGALREERESGSSLPKRRSRCPLPRRKSGRRRERSLGPPRRASRAGRVMPTTNARGIGSSSWRRRRSRSAASEYSRRTLGLSSRSQLEVVFVEQSAQIRAKVTIGRVDLRDRWSPSSS